jgi:hypothetical protein
MEGVSFRMCKPTTRPVKPRRCGDLFVEHLTGLDYALRRHRRNMSEVAERGGGGDDAGARERDDDARTAIEHQRARAREAGRCGGLPNGGRPACAAGAADAAAARPRVAAVIPAIFPPDDVAGGSKMRRSTWGYKGHSDERASERVGQASVLFIRSVVRHYQWAAHRCK